MEDCLFITVETSACFLGNAPALPDADSREKEIQTFTENLRRVIKYAQQKADIGDKPSWSDRFLSRYTAALPGKANGSVNLAV